MLFLYEYEISAAVLASYSDVLREKFAALVHSSKQNFTV
jgi:hypothetical protein